MLGCFKTGEQEYGRNRREICLLGPESCFADDSIFIASIIYQITIIDTCRHQIIHQLRFMNRVNLTNSLKFYYH